jgi:hypothetical protein
MEAEDFLEHHGVKGMKWGKRKDRERNPKYTDNQIKRDRQIYGRRGSNRVNRALNRGDSISVARGDEKRRKDSALRSNKYARRAGKATGTIVGGTAGWVGANYAAYGLRTLATTAGGQRFIGGLFGTKGTSAVYTAALLASSPTIRRSMTSGAAIIGYHLGGDAAVAANMRIRGYDPKRRD